MLWLIGDQAGGTTGLQHYFVTGIDAGTAVDTGNLQTVTDINIGRADLHTQTAVDAIAAAVGIARVMLTPGFATRAVVAYGAGLVIEHHRLKAGIGAHMGADGFAQPAGVEKGEGADQDQPEHSNAADISLDNITPPLRQRVEVGNDGNGGRQTEQSPGNKLQCPANLLLAGPFTLIQLAAHLA